MSACTQLSPFLLASWFGQRKYFLNLQKVRKRFEIAIFSKHGFTNRCIILFSTARPNICEIYIWISIESLFNILGNSYSFFSLFLGREVICFSLLVNICIGSGGHVVWSFFCVHRSDNRKHGSEKLFGQQVDVHAISMLFFLVVVLVEYVRQSCFTLYVCDENYRKITQVYKVYMSYSREQSTYIESGDWKPPQKQTPIW